jgi:hypothetical protein
MLFRKKIERSCTYCSNGTRIDDELILCVKKGVVPGDKPCWKFRYDPTKRIPAKEKPVDFSKYDEEDYSL